MNLTPEQELVLLLAEYRNPRKARIVELVSQKLDWSYVLGHVVYNRTAGLAYHVLSQCELQGASIHREFRLGLYTAYEFQLMRTKGYKSLVEEIATSLDASGLPYALLKGAILAFSTYPMGCRVSNDIDILVRPEHLTGVGQALKAAGFTQGYYDPAIRAIQPATRHEILSARMNGGQIIPYQKAVHVPGIDFVAVDVNFSLDWVASGTESKVAAFLEASVLYPLTDSPVMVRSLSREHFLAHLCAHRFKEAYVLTWVQSQRDLSLYKFVDIYGFLTESGQRINWDRFAKIAADNLIVRECYYALALTRTFFPVLNQDQEFVKSLEQLAPADTSYLDHVVEATNSKSRYQWTSDLITRFFDSKRYQTLVPLP